MEEERERRPRSRPEEIRPRSERGMGWSWAEVCSDFEQEMADLKRQAGLRPWEPWTGKEGNRGRA